MLVQYLRGFRYFQPVWLRNGLQTDVLSVRMGPAAGNREFLVSVFMANLAGPLAMSSCELRQARKGATVAVRACAGVRLAGCAAILLYSINCPGP